MNKYIIGIIIVLIVAAGLIFGLRSQNSTDDTSEATTTMDISADTSTVGEDTATDSDTSTSVAVRYTANGYEPKTITVPVGTTVTFTNESSSGMWTASDPHPVHTKLSSFDSDRNIANGQSYSYTFEQAGNWAYHNHSTPGHTGTVIVE